MWCSARCFFFFWFLSGYIEFKQFSNFYIHSRYCLVVSPSTRLDWITKNKPCGWVIYYCQFFDVVLSLVYFLFFFYFYVVVGNGKNIFETIININKLKKKKKKKNFFYDVFFFFWPKLSNNNTKTREICRLRKFASGIDKLCYIYYTHKKRKWFFFF